LGRIWSTGASIIENVTLGLYDLSGQGTGGTFPIFKEGAVLVEWECQRPNVLGRKVYLRKYIRPGALPGTLPAETITGQAPIPQTEKDRFKAYADTVQSIQVGSSLEPFLLCAPSGREPRNPSNGVVNNFLISREFRRN